MEKKRRSRGRGGDEAKTKRARHAKTQCRHPQWRAGPRHGRPPRVLPPPAIPEAAIRVRASSASRRRSRCKRSAPRVRPGTGPPRRQPPRPPDAVAEGPARRGTRATRARAFVESKGGQACDGCDGGGAKTSLGRSVVAPFERSHKGLPSKSCPSTKPTSLSRCPSARAPTFWKKKQREVGGMERHDLFGSSLSTPRLLPRGRSTPTEPERQPRRGPAPGAGATPPCAGESIDTRTSPRASSGSSCG